MEHRFFLNAALFACMPGGLSASAEEDAADANESRIERHIAVNPDRPAVAGRRPEKKQNNPRHGVSCC